MKKKKVWFNKLYVRGKKRKNPLTWTLFGNGHILNRQPDVQVSGTSQCYQESVASISHYLQALLTNPDLGWGGSCQRTALSFNLSVGLILLGGYCWLVLSGSTRNIKVACGPADMFHRSPATLHSAVASEAPHRKLVSFSGLFFCWSFFVLLKTMAF